MVDDVTVWSVDLDDEGVGRMLDSVPLGVDEGRQALRFIHAGDARRFRRRRAFRRVVLGGLLGVDPGRVEFVHGPFGKPVLAGPAGHHPFSATHSGGRSWLAVGSAGPLGIDAELETSLRSELPGLVGQLAPAEQRALERVADAGRTGAFLDVWTRKEAVLKAAGTGLRHDLNSFAVPVGALPDGDWVALGVGTSRWWVRDLQLGAPFRGALACEAPCRVARRDYPMDWPFAPSKTA